MTLEILPCGDTAFSVQFGDRIDRSLSARVMRLHALIRQDKPPGIVETVPTFRSLLVHYDPLQTNQAELVSAIRPMLDQPAESSSKGAVWRLPVCYDPSFGIDLPAISGLTGLQPDEIVRVHSSTRHYVYMVGFAPGHPYMGDLPETLSVPRRQDPRTEVSPGTVATAVGMTVIYPFASPSGWHIVGRTPVPVFDPNREPPVLLKAGDTVLCQPVDRAEYDRIRQDVHTGRFRPVVEETHR